MATTEAGDRASSRRAVRTSESVADTNNVRSSFAALQAVTVLQDEVVGAPMAEQDQDLG